MAMYLDVDYSFCRSGSRRIELNVNEYITI